MYNQRRATKRKQRLESEGLLSSKIEKKRQIIEDKLKALGYYEGEVVMFMLNADSIDVTGLRVERKSNFMEPVHCGCTYNIDTFI